MGQFGSKVLDMTGFGNGYSPYSRQRNRQRNYRKSLKKPRDMTETELQQITLAVLDLIHAWFPERHERTYFLPPVHMNKIQYRTVQVGGKETLEIQKTPESDWRDDEVMQRVLLCLRALTDRRKEPMVVLVQMQHDNYLNKLCFAAATSAFPRPTDLPINLRRGDFDLLFLHRQHGLVVAEIKSVGWRPGGEQDDDTVKKKVGQALQQLDKARTVLQHLVNDLTPTPRITHTLVLPNVTATRLLGLLDNDHRLAEAFCSCFEVLDVVSAVHLCLCAEQMTSMEKPADVTDAILEKLEKWWLHLVAGGEHALQGCTPEVYDLLVARFCGPASTVQVHCVRAPRLEFRTLGHAVQEVGERMVQFVLFPQQLALLQEQEACVYLTGPPGTGKTLLLILMALQWVRRGHVVHVVSTESFSEASAQLVYHQVTQTLAATDPEAASRVKLHSNGNSTRHTEELLAELLADSQTTSSTTTTTSSSSTTTTAVTSQTAPLPHHDTTTTTTAMTTATTAQRPGSRLFVVADEVEATFRGLFDRLRNNVEDLHVWAASYSHGHRPEGMAERRLLACVRSTPTVVRRMETAVSFSRGSVYRFEDRRQEYLSPTNGPAELYLSHEDHELCPAMDCMQCGMDIADCLHQKLGVGTSRPSDPAVKTPPPLRYSDVMIIPDWYQNIKDLSDGDAENDPASTTIPAAGGQTPASGLVRGLRSRGVPTYVVRSQDRSKIRDLARAARDAVAVVVWGVSNGLERKVVVSVGEGREMTQGVSGVLHGASRCVSQLVYVRCPENDVIA